MNSTTTNNLSTFFQPTIVILSPFSNHEETLLNGVLPEKGLVNQSLNFNISKYTAINQNRTNISIDTIRDLTAELTYGTYGGEVRYVCIYHADLATIPAQNALLKLLEEPPAQTAIFLTTANIERILDTIQSRCSIEQAVLNDTENNDFDISLYRNTYSKIQTSSRRELIELAQEYSERPQALEVVQSLVRLLHSELTAEPTNTLYAQQIKVLLLAGQQIEQNCSTKLVLEHCFFEIKGQLST